MTCQKSQLIQREHIFCTLRYLISREDIFCTGQRMISLLRQAQYIAGRHLSLPPNPAYLEQTNKKSKKAKKNQILLLKKMKCFGHHKGKELAVMQGIYKFYEKIPLSATTCQRGGQKNRIMQPRIRTSHVYRSVDFNNLQSLEDMIQALFGNRKCFQLYHEWSESMHKVQFKDMKFYPDC